MGPDFFISVSRPHGQAKTKSVQVCENRGDYSYRLLKSFRFIVGDRGSERKAKEAAESYIEELKKTR